MNARRCLLGLTFCTCYLASHLTNKYVLSVLKFTYPTLFQGWQTFIGGLLLHVSWKLGWVEINSSPRSNVLTWLPASLLFVGIIYAGSRALSRLAVPVFFILHNVAEVLICGYQKYVWKEKTSFTKICSALFLLAAAGCFPFQDSELDPDGYFWAVIHVFCVGAYRILRKAQKPSVLSDIDQQYLNYIFSMVLLAFASHPTDATNVEVRELKPGGVQCRDQDEAEQVTSSVSWTFHSCTSTDSTAAAGPGHHSRPVAGAV
ncbi:transmembrane protein 241 isoform X4 [Meriones unguiculatus]|uniref:transmembrane protein 241 isoform X4 n=1 Tax=Meriones unguiculatus TaxID=10047 RepID=UPI00293E7741|nr:transmembrane protein 241 isoform X4 [Meriones unguiculatus]